MAVEAMIRRVPKGGTRSIKALARQLGYLSRQTDPDRENIVLVGAERHRFNPGTPDAVDPNNVRAFAHRLYLRSGRLPLGNFNSDLENDLTMHFVISFPNGTDPVAAEQAGREWAESVFGLGFRDGPGPAQQHDYVTAFHNHGAERDHPHMHVVVDRVPFGGGNLLTLSRNHPHWSYEAMRFQAVDAAATYGIELVATTRMPATLIQAQRPLTQAEHDALRSILMTRPITQDEHRRRQDDARLVPYHDAIFDEQDRAPGANELGAYPTLENVQQACEPVYVPDPDTRNGPGNDQNGNGGGGGGPGNGPDTRPGGGAPPRDQNQGPSNLDQDFDMGDDDRGEGPSGTQHETPPPDESDQTQPAAGSSNGTNNQPLPLTAENLARLNQFNEVAERARQAQRSAQRDQREQENENDDDRRRRLPQRNESPLSTLTPLSSTLSTLTPLPSTSDGSGPASQALNQTEDALAAERARQAQRSAQRDQREQDHDDDDDRRRRLPQRSESPLTSLPSTSDGSGGDSQEQQQALSPAAARQALDIARAAERDYQRTRPQDGSAEALRAWNAGLRQRAAETRQARTVLNAARFGTSNIATRSRGRQEAAPIPGPSRAAGDAARQAQADHRRTNHAQREREIESEDENRRRRTPANQEQQQALSPAAARQALTDARLALEAHRQTRPGGGSDEEARNWRIEQQRRRGEVRDADAALQTARFGTSNVTTRAQAQAQAQAEAEQNRNARGRQRRQQDPGPSRSNHDRSN